VPISRIASLCLVVLLVKSQAFAATAPVPVLLRLPDDSVFEAPKHGQPGSGLIADWAASGVNKQQTKKIARFRAWLPDGDLLSKARATFACARLGAPDEGCRTEAQLPKDEKELAELLRSGAAKRAFIVTLQPIMAPAGLSLRVPVAEVDWDGLMTAPLRTFVAVYGARVPRSLETRRGVTEDEYKQFWQSGTPSRLSVTANTGVEEVARLVEVLAANVAPDESVPKEWSDLPKIKTLEKAGRARCSGVPCAGVRIYRDTAEQLWLTFIGGFLPGYLPPSVGAAMISLDPDAALFETNVWTISFLGY